MFEKVLFASLILQVTQAVAKTCTEASDSSQTGQCKKGKCISIGEDSVCTDCAKPGEVPINGECKDKTDGLITTAGCEKADGALDEQSTTCEKCTKTGYFLHKGGCYAQATPPGQTICKSAGSSAGLCETCNDVNGFFKNAGASDNTHQSCIACNEAEAVDGFRGIPNCKVCTSPVSPGYAICTGCEGDYYLLAGSPIICITEVQCKADSDHFPTTVEGIKKCIACGDAEAGGIADCETCALKEARMAEAPVVTCNKCAGEKVPDGDGSACVNAPEPSPSDCLIENCQKCSADNQTCEECKDMNYLTPTRMCVSDCATIPGYYGADGKPRTCKPCEITDCATCNPQGQCETCKDGYYKNGAACTKCDDSCKTCANGEPNGCTSCGSSKALKYEGAGNTGTCGEGCKPVSGGTDGTCKTCGLSIDGTSYCSVCNTDKEYPESGVCVKRSARTTSCQAEPSGGVCGTCAKGFFRIDGGCYETAKFPGKSVCADANADADTCKTPVPGYKIEAGKLVTCSEGCDTCSDANTCTKCKDGYVLITSKCTPCSAGCATCTGTAAGCSTCSTGYYKSGPKCIACDKDDSAIKGISNCLNCAPPSTGSGSVLCYLTKDDSTGGSTNRSGLSTGAIAGIAVAAVVVVGGLVGFLCWWFLCRGKA
ncbi:VSP [Giardia lamblia P15]|uniref:VSP n=1 Tax=Giardia intestinalis (strain P15) TaxID=658858 RepID=E1EWG3_GIAIA|nr:VSP [Giardia lamblia P15]